MLPIVPVFAQWEMAVAVSRPSIKGRAGKGPGLRRGRAPLLTVMDTLFKQCFCCASSSCPIERREAEPPCQSALWLVRAAVGQGAVREGWALGRCLLSSQDGVSAGEPVQHPGGAEPRYGGLRSAEGPGGARGDSGGFGPRAELEAAGGSGGR